MGGIHAAAAAEAIRQKMEVDQGGCPLETCDLAKELPETKILQVAWDLYAKDVGVVITK